MEGSFAPLERSFSAIEGLQAAHRLCYSMQIEPDACQLTLQRIGNAACKKSCRVAVGPTRAYGLLLYLYENAIQPEHWQDILDDLCGTERGIAQ